MHFLRNLIAILFLSACAGASLSDTAYDYLEQAKSTLFEYGQMFQSTLSQVDAGTDQKSSFCMSSEDASIVGTGFGHLISGYTTELAEQLLAEGFVDQADSVNTLINNSPLPHQTLGSLTFDSKKAFKEGQGAQPPVPFDILNSWNTCDTVIIRWRSNQKPDPVQGVSIGIVQLAKEGEGGGVGATAKYQIKTMYAEFNSGAWLNNLGKPECNKENFKGWETDHE